MRPSATSRKRRSAQLLSAVLRLAAMCVVLPACEHLPAPSSSEATEAEFGIYFGGQVQSREEIPFRLDSIHQKMGFRVQLARPLPQDTRLRWELSKPGKTWRKKKLADPDERVTALGDATLKRGAQRFEQQLSFKPGDPLGLWNIRVVLGERVLLDRPFNVYDPLERKRERRAAKRPDAGL